jgi:SAM-dependent methyltransferase
MSKYVDWIPTRPEDMDPFFKLAPLTASDCVYDLGSGDGRLLFAALEKGAGCCVGIDIDADLVQAAREKARQKGIADKVHFIQSDILEADLSSATVVLCFLYPTAFGALRLKFEEELKPGARVVMESFPILEWKPVKKYQKPGRNFYLYTMPPELVSEEDII